MLANIMPASPSGARVCYDGFKDWLKNMDRVMQEYNSHSLYLMFPKMSMDQAHHLLAYADEHWSDVKGTFCVEHGLR